jgi:hypothetical protein
MSSMLVTLSQLVRNIGPELLPTTPAQVRSR